MSKRNEEGFRLVIDRPHEKGIIKTQIKMEKAQFWALAESLSLRPTNQEAAFGWSDDFIENGYYLLYHDDIYYLLTIPYVAQKEEF